MATSRNLVLDAIVVSYNTRDLTHSCVASLLVSTRKVRRLYVVDNASTDGSAEMVRSQFPSVELIELPENVGFAQGNNAAFERSDADLIFLLNADAEITPEALGCLESHLLSDEHVGMVGPVLVGADGRVQYEGARRDPSILGEFGNISHLNVRYPNGRLGGYLMSDWDHRSTRDVEVLSGACMLIRREVLGDKLFRDDFFMYGEDIEICQRLRADGWCLRYAGDVEVLHHGGAASKKARTKMRIAGVVSMAQLLSRSRGPLYAAGYVAIVPVAWLVGVVLRRLWPL